MRKPRSDSELKNKPVEFQQMVWDRLKAGLKGEDCRTWLAQEHGVTRGTTLSCISEFYSWFPQSQRLNRVAQSADKVREQLQKNPRLKEDAALVSDAAQIVFEQLAMDTDDVELYEDLRYLRLKELDLKLKQEGQSHRIKIYEEKAAQLRASLEKAKTKGGISSETLALIEEQLKLL
jgi:hypothetical protein